MTHDEEAAVAKAAFDLALIAAPIYIDNRMTMKQVDAMRVAVREAITLIGAAKEFIKCA